MAANIEHASAVEPRRAQTTVPTSTSNSPKISIFGAKSGFVIPKNKLSGALVPVFRGGGKLEANDTSKEESITKQAHRKTKWGVDLTQDAAVRRGRALAYQTRVEQITKQLESGILEVGDDQGSHPPSPIPSRISSAQQTDNKARSIELLDLERREAIGEILRLNPSYKAPPGYKPVLREAKVPIPLKAYPGYNFIGLILGPESNTQKRLEVETGAKIRVHGTKADTGDEIEISQSDADEARATFEELYVHISADTFEKVDTAVALIELLVTPVSGNAVAVSTSTPGDTTNVLDPSQKEPNIGYVMPMGAVNQGGVLPMMVAAQPGLPRGQFQPYLGLWQPLGPPYAPMRPPPSGFIPAPNSAPLASNPTQFPPPTMPRFGAPLFFRGRPPAAAGFGPALRNPSLVTSGPQLQSMQVLQRPYIPEARPPNQIAPPRSQPMLNLRPQPTYTAVAARPNLGMPAPFPARQPVQIGPPSPAARPLISSTPVSSSPPGPPPSRPLLPMPSPGGSSGWSGAPNVSPLRPVNMIQPPPPMMPPQRPIPPLVQPAVTPVTPRANVLVTPVTNPPTANAIPPASFPFRPSTPQLSSTPVNHPNAAPAFTSVPLPIGASPILPPRGQMPPPASALVSAPIGLTQAQTSLPLPMPSLPPGPSSMPASAPARAPAPAPPPVYTRAPAPSFSAPAPSLSQAPPPMLASSPASAIQQGATRARPPMLSPAPAQGRAPAPLPIPPPPPRSAPAAASASPVSGSLPSFSPASPPITSPTTIPPVTAPKPQRPSSSDFTFQPQKSQIPSSQNVARPAIQNAPPPMPSPRTSTPPMSPALALQPPSAPQAPSFRLAVHNSPASPSVMPGFTRPPQAANQPPVRPPLPQPPPVSGVSFAGTSNPPLIRPQPVISITTITPPRQQAFPNSPRPVALATSIPQMGPRSFMSAPQMPNPSPLLIRPMNLQQLQQNQASPGNRQNSFAVPNNQVSSGNLGYSAAKPASSSSGGNQVYDPFSPTSIAPANSQQGGEAGKPEKPETDAEYEDLMASVGVR